MKVISKNLEETIKTAQDFVSKLKNVNSEQATVVGLFGDLGSGKTTFSQALGKELGVEDVMTSPTFVIEKIYLLNGQAGNFKNLIHIDAYRLDSGGELLTLGFAEVLKNPENLILIEWPERVEEVLPKDMIKLYFKFISENEREIDL